MKLRRIVALMVIVALSLVGITRWSAAGAADDPKAVALEKELRQLRDERVATSSLMVDATRAAFESGTLTIDVVLDSFKKLAEARLAIATTPAERLAALDEHLTLARVTEQKIEALYKTGSRGGEVCVYTMAKQARQSAQIALVEEQLRAANAQAH